MEWLQTFIKEKLPLIMKMPDMEDLFLPFLATMFVGFVVSAITYRMRSHRHQTSFLNAYNPLVALGSLSMLGFALLYSLKKMGVFDKVPFTFVNAALRNSIIVGGILFSVAIAPLLDDIRHQYQHHRW